MIYILEVNHWEKIHGPYTSLEEAKKDLSAGDELRFNQKYLILKRVGSFHTDSSGRIFNQQLKPAL